MREGTVQPRSDAIRRLRQARGWTQEDLAHKVGCSKRTIENLEAGKAARVRTLAEIAAAFGSDVKVSDLIAADQGIAPTEPVRHPAALPGNAPPLAALMIGRDRDLELLCRRLQRATASERSPTQVLTAMRGWPGVGKTTLAKAIAHSPEMSAAFPDGVLWASLGPGPAVLAELLTWGRMLRDEQVGTARGIAEASSRLAGLLRERRMLLVVDDVWDPSHALPFLVGGRACATLVTTRLPAVAAALAPSPDDSYWLDVLSEPESLDLLATLAPGVVDAHPGDCRELAAALEGLPLALQVAGRLLRAEQRHGWGVAELLAELRADATKLLNAPGPPDMAHPGAVSPTVAALLRKSTDHLDPLTRQRFTRLAPFAPRPASFELEDLAGMWHVQEAEARRTVDVLVDRGLLEPSGDGEYQIHQVLVQHAKALYNEGRQKK